MEDVHRLVLDDTGLDVQINELREALLQLEREGYLRVQRQNVVLLG